MEKLCRNVKIILDKFSTYLRVAKYSNIRLVYIYRQILYFRYYTLFFIALVDLAHKQNRINLCRYIIELTLEKAYFLHRKEAALNICQQICYTIECTIFIYSNIYQFYLFKNIKI